jgi:acetyl esterase
MTTTTSSPQVRFTPVIEPRTQQWLDAVAAASAGSPPLWELSSEDARQLVRSLQTSVPVQLQPADIEDRVIPGGPTGQVSIQIIRPTGLLPMVLYLHGGGWILGDKDTHEQLYRELANAAQAVVVFVDYTLVPTRTTRGKRAGLHGAISAHRDLRETRETRSDSG